MQARTAICEWQRKTRPRLAKCGARTRPAGEPCRNPAMSNGRCWRHGGTTPRGDAWHTPRWPKDGPGAERKLQRKLATLERAARKRAERLAAMTPEQLAKHRAWHKARKPGSAAARAIARRDRKQAAELRALVAASQSKNEAR